MAFRTPRLLARRLGIRAPLVGLVVSSGLLLAPPALGKCYPGVLVDVPETARLGQPVAVRVVVLQRARIDAGRLVRTQTPARPTLELRARDPGGKVRTVTRLSHLRTGADRSVVVLDRRGTWQLSVWERLDARLAYRCTLTPIRIDVD